MEGRIGQVFGASDLTGSTQPITHLTLDGAKFGFRLSIYPHLPLDGAKFKLRLELGLIVVELARVRTPE